jgi:hypothetical protein
MVLQIQIWERQLRNDVLEHTANILIFEIVMVID